MLHVSDEDREGHHTGVRACCSPWLGLGNAAGENTIPREKCWEVQEQHPSVWLQRAMLVQAGRGSDQAAGWRFRPTSLSGKPIADGARVFMGTSRRPRHGQAVLGVPGEVPGIWRSLVNHSIVLPGSCLLLRPIKLLERPGEAEGVESGLGWDPGPGAAIHPAV